MTNRELNQRRISWATRGLAAAAALATALFAAAAAHNTSEARSQTGTPATVVENDGEDDFGSSFLTPSRSAPSQTFTPAIASSGGS